MSEPVNSLLVTWGATLTGAGLILLGLHVFVPEFAAWGYGVYPLEPKGEGYLIATGMRDLSLGLITLYLLRNFRAALGMFFLFLLVVPIADTAIVLKYGASPAKVFPHAVGIVVLAVISMLAFGEQKNLPQRGLNDSTAGSPD
jgi:hypothetical protein